MEIKSHWSNRIHPCLDNCGYIGPLDAFRDGQCYSPCPNCGGQKHPYGRTGRFVYKLEKRRWLPFLKKKVFVRVEWRDED